jgi:dipeptide transport system substrate-binding protein
MTVEFVLNQPEAPFIADLAMDFASILSEEFASKLKAAGTPEKLDTMPVGTGPFILTKYTKDSQIRYQANSEYFRGAPKINTLVFSITPDASVRYQKLKAGECHLITEPSPVDLPLMKKDARLNVLNRAGLNIAYLAFQTEKAPFNQKKVREAIGLALNKKNYVDAIYLGQGEVAKNPIPPTMWSYDQSVQDQTYQVEKAKALLKEANFPFDQTFDLWTMPVSRPYNPNGKKMGELMQADLAKVGVKIKLVTYDWPTYLAKSKKEANYHMIQMGWSGDNGDPDNFLNVLLSCDSIKAGSNLAHWCNTAFDSLINQAKTTSQVSKRTDLYKKAQKLFRQELPWITIAHSTVHRAMLKSVKGYVIDAFGGDQFAEVDLQ